jgi:hypothetical protein
LSHMRTSSRDDASEKIQYSALSRRCVFSIASRSSTSIRSVCRRYRFIASCSGVQGGSCRAQTLSASTRRSLRVSSSLAPRRNLISGRRSSGSLSCSAFESHTLCCSMISRTCDLSSAVR